LLLLLLATNSAAGAVLTPRKYEKGARFPLEFSLGSKQQVLGLLLGLEGGGGAGDLLPLMACSGSKTSPTPNDPAG